ncbi:MAG: rod shape-determining protein MreC [Saprospiraceae bacterium]|nr:rod shape-determining protein MreC [Bacteroidia bacterium]NNL93811.1 rod shape-determining protein MreC [Saprospiraceae bacterium]
MRNLITLILRYSALIAFLILELIAFFLIINYNKSQKEIWAHSSNLLSGNLFKQVEKIQDFFELQEVNDSLLTENAKLLETIINYRIDSKNNSFQRFEKLDTTFNYQLIPSRICNKTINVRNNYMTLCKGKNDGLKVGMGVISNKGVVGIIKTVSKDFATVLLVLNSQSRISAKVTSKNYFGNLIWDEGDVRSLSMVDVPKHADIAVGDSISTSGYSISFPPDIHIGTIESYSLIGGSNNYKIKVKMKEDVGAVEYVYAIKYLQAMEKDTLLRLENE